MSIYLAIFEFILKYANVLLVNSCLGRVEVKRIPVLFVDGYKTGILNL